MNLTLFFIILSLIVGYLLYDSLRKSKEKANKTSETVNNRLKINYTRECATLNTLNKEKINSLKKTTISIHLVGESSELTEKQIAKTKQIITKIINSAHIFLLERENKTQSSLHSAIKEVIGSAFVIPYNSTEGAVAILRQLSCGLHLESEMNLYSKIRQYISKIWLVGADPALQALREFKSEAQMIEMLEKLQTGQENQMQ